jgi:hypothetical protein
LALLALGGLAGSIAIIAGAVSDRHPDASAEQPGPTRRERRRADLSGEGDVRVATLHRVHVDSPGRTCADCHDFPSQTFTTPSEERCVGCHPDNQPALHAESRTGADGCLTCHDFLAADGEVGAGGPDPAPPVGGAARARSRPLIEGPDVDCAGCHVEAQGAHRAIDVHIDQDCLRCHTAHAARPARAEAKAECLECHAEQATRHTGGVRGNETCQGCHAPHEPGQKAAATCADCHAKANAKTSAIPAGAIFAGGHDACVTCHVGHDIGRETAADCRSCHDEQPVLAAKVTGHQECTSCHDPHAPLAAPASRCVSCHSKVSPQHPPGGGKSCVGCHPPHDSATRDAVVALACTGACHKSTREKPLGHASAKCVDCHRPHRFAVSLDAKHGGARDFCLDCHDQPIGDAREVKTSAGHSACDGCHKDPHAPTAPRPACGTCHDKKAASVSAGHADCGRCHETHTGARHAIAKDCASCHGPEATTAPVGHRDCSSCHDTHSGKQKQMCSSCHADRAAGVHLSIDGGCRSCHRPHGPDGTAAPPTCTSCHETRKLPAMHTIADHQDCAKCHTPHAERSIGRATCLAGCHAEQKNHEPGATACQACHPFGDER